MKYFIVGIRGSAMSGLAEILRAQGHEVSGSDVATTGHNPENVSGSDRVVYTPAVRPGSPGWVEVAAAQEQGIEAIRLDELLGELTTGKRLVAITGTHGKSSTTAMVAHILESTGKNPMVLLGAPVSGWEGRNYRIGSDSLWVLEADEYERKFLTLTPDVAVVTNLEFDHADVFNNLSELRAAFGEFLARTKPSGTVVVNDDSSLDQLMSGLSPDVSIIRYGDQSEIYQPKALGLSNLKVIGHFQELNASAAVAAAEASGVPRQEAIQALASFRGTGRRLELVGTIGDILVFDDYAHHPTEIRVTLEALKERYPNRRLVVAFQPHQRSRTEALFADYITCFKDADLLLLTDIFVVPGRDAETGITSEKLAKEIGKNRTNVKYIGNLGNLLEAIEQEARPGDVVVTMGATEITKVGRDWVKAKNPGDDNG